MDLLDGPFPLADEAEVLENFRRHMGDGRNALVGVRIVRGSHGTELYMEAMRSGRLDLVLAALLLMDAVAKDFTACPCGADHTLEVAVCRAVCSELEQLSAGMGRSAGDFVWH